MTAQPFLSHNYCHDCELSFTSTSPHARYCADCTTRRDDLAARLAESTRTICEDCGCEEYCIDYLRNALADRAPAPVNPADVAALSH